MDFDLVGREFLRALRGRRSQTAWSRRLGYRSNVVYAWESGRRWPTAAETFRAARRSGIDLERALARFYGERPRWLEELEPTTPEAIARLLNDLRGSASITDLARRAGLSRYSVSRWLSATTQPRLPDFLRAVEAASLRSVDLLAAFVEPAAMPSVAPLWRRLEARRRSAHEQPWTQAVLRALELADYRALPAHDPAWIARRLGISLEEVRRCLEFLEATEQVQRAGRHLETRTAAVDTRRHPEVGRGLKAHWTGVGQARIQAGAPGQFSYNVFTVSREDFERIRALHLEYFHALRAIVGESEPGECVAVANVQLFALDDHPQE
jgi:DNA-binding phage protein/DNA-binding Lrp family transcriptional regulator